MPRDDIEAQRRAILYRIHRAFQHVWRDGGVSWSEAAYLDGPGVLPMEERLKLRKQDKDHSWEELVDDPEWELEDGEGLSRFIELDALGFRYYLPVAMIRTARRGEGPFLEVLLTLASDGPSREHKLEQWKLLNVEQQCCVRDFVRFMAAVDAPTRSAKKATKRQASKNNQEQTAQGSWKQALASHWDAIQTPVVPFAAERQAMIERIERDFASVTRDNGTSWSEADLLDGPGASLPMSARLTVRAKDKDQHWRELVDDPEWNKGGDSSSFTFLDAIGYRYYLAPAMVRWVREGHSELALDFHLTLPNRQAARDYTLEKWSLLSDPQRACVRDFLRFMDRIEMATSKDPDETTSWRRALESYWDEIAG